MLERYRRILTKYRPQLVDEIELESGSGLLNLLLSKGVLTNRQAKSFSCLVDPYKQIEAILDALYRRPDSDYFLFCDALSETGQGHIVDNYLRDHSAQAVKYLIESKNTVPTQATGEPLDLVQRRCGDIVNLHSDVETDLQRHGVGVEESHYQERLQDHSTLTLSNSSQPVVVTQCSRAVFQNSVPKTSTNLTGCGKAFTANPGSGPTVIHSVQVKQSTTEFYEMKKADSYNMSIKCRGRCVIMNISNVAGFPARNGSERDVSLLSELFHQLHFVVDVHADLSCHDMKRTILNLSQSPDLASSQALVLIVMSHGNTVNSSSADQTSPHASLGLIDEDVVSVQNEVVFGSDGQPVTTRDLLAPLTNDNCSHLRAKPRIVVFQACRGNEYDTVLTETDAMPSSVPDRELEIVAQVEAVPIDIDLSDFIIGFPTQAGFRSFRNPDTGSWYVNAIVQVFMQRACDMDVTAMLRKVNEMVLTWLPWTRDPQMSGRGQVACISDNLKRPFLYLFPGITTTDC